MSIDACTKTIQCCSFFYVADAKAGGAAAPNVAKITKHKMQSDEALKILHIEGLKNLNAEILIQVQAYYDNCIHCHGQSAERCGIWFDSTCILRHCSDTRSFLMRTTRRKVDLSTSNLRYTERKRRSQQNFTIWTRRLKILAEDLLLAAWRKKACNSRRHQLLRAELSSPLSILTSKFLWWYL